MLDLRPAMPIESERMDSTANMDQPKFNEPRIALNRIYTKRGDSGETSLAGEGEALARFVDDRDAGITERDFAGAV